MSDIKAIQRPEQLQLRRWDFQFSIKRMLWAMTASAVLLSIGLPAGLGMTGSAILVLVILVILFNDWSLMTLREAHRLAVAGKLDAALREYDKAIRALPESPDRYCYRAQVYLQQGNREAAIADYSEAIRRESRFVPAWMGRASAHYHGGNLVQAREDATIILCLAPEHANARVLRAHCDAMLGDFAAAQADLDAATAHASNPAEIHGMRATMYLWAEENTKALYHYQVYRRACPADDRVTPMLVRAHFGLGEYLQAIQLLEAYLTKWPQSSEGNAALAFFLATCPDDTLRDGPRSVKLAERSLEHRPMDTGTTLSALAAAYAEVGQFDRAVAASREALELAPPCLRAERQRRLALYQSGQPYRVQPHP